jgi:hypothetical protein
VMYDGISDNEVVKTFPSRKMDHPITLTSDSIQRQWRIYCQEVA